MLQSQPFLYCGKITYGIYVYHMFAPDILRTMLSFFGATYTAQGWLNFTFVTLATVATASLSWHLFEQPINGLKRYFSYNGAATAGSIVTNPIASDASISLPH